jgi:antitoxin PrlF
MGYAVTKKGQVTIPKHIREQLGVNPGSEVEYEIDSTGQVIMKGKTLEAYRQELIEASKPIEGFDGDSVSYVRWLRGE